MSIYLVIAGNHPELSAAELSACFPGAVLRFPMPEWIEMTVERDLKQEDFDRLGGALKMARVLETVPREGVIEGLIAGLQEHYRGSKLDYGVSLYGMPERSLRPLLLELKKTLRQNDIKTRFVNHDFKNVSAAQYKSLRKAGVELVVAKSAAGYQVAEVVGVQDIDAYSARDYEKPERDMRRGMLPPKLAQILINLTGVTGTVWDPFCGVGALVMEGLLMGHPMLASDIDPPALMALQKNTDWLRRVFNTRTALKCFTHDARKAIPAGIEFDAVAAEGYLGPPQSRPLNLSRFGELESELEPLYADFFRRLAEHGGKAPVVLALPCYRLQGGTWADLKRLIRKIETFGFKAELGLRYARADQVVGRMIYRFRPL